MTREEAIKVLQNEVNCAQNDRCSLRCDSCEFFVTDDQVQTAHETAISALQQQGNKRNEPLTLDELREMDNQPVWIEDVGEYKWHGSGWAIVDREYCLVRKASNGNPAFFERYGKEWIAYRQKPVEDDDHA